MRAPRRIPGRATPANDNSRPLPAAPPRLIRVAGGVVELIPVERGVVELIPVEG